MLWCLEKKERKKTPLHFALYKLKQVLQKFKCSFKCYSYTETYLQLLLELASLLENYEIKWQRELSEGCISPSQTYTVTSHGKGHIIFQGLANSRNKIQKNIHHVRHQIPSFIYSCSALKYIQQTQVQMKRTVDSKCSLQHKISYCTLVLDQTFTPIFRKRIPTNC